MIKKIKDRIRLRYDVKWWGHPGYSYMDYVRDESKTKLEMFIQDCVVCATVTVSITLYIAAFIIAM